MGRTLANKLATLPAARRKAIEGRAADLIAEEMALWELRRVLGRTQSRVAQDLGLGQEAVSKLETRTDMLISTAARDVRKAGGRLTSASFPPPLRGARAYFSLSYAFLTYATTTQSWLTAHLMGAPVCLGETGGSAGSSHDLRCWFRNSEAALHIANGGATLDPKCARWRKLPVAKAPA